MDNLIAREECKKLIDQLGIIKKDKIITIAKANITNELMQSILFHTNNCRDRLSERIYWILNDIEDYPKCKECGTNFKPRFYGISGNYHGWTFCSFKCSTLNNDTQDKMKSTCLINLGFEHPAQNKKVQEKMQSTCFERHGVKHAAQSEEVQEKMQSTCFERYGVKHAAQSEEVKEKNKQTCLQNHGVEYPQQKFEIREKGKQTCREKYNVENVMQHIEIFKKAQSSLYSTKFMTLPSGIEITYQGYENVAIITLLEKSYLEDQLILDRDLIPTIKYEFENKSRVYFPDIFIPHENKIIEVKSIWTYDKDLEKNLAKRLACLDQGYQFEFWICSDKELLEIK
jgi:hypothetical protein